MVGHLEKSKGDIKSLRMCQLCNRILQESFKLLCGDHICKSCMQGITGNIIKCPKCSQETHLKPFCEICRTNFSSNTTLDEHKQKECTGTIVSCDLKEYGCSDSIYRVQLSEHYLSDVHQNAIINVIRRLPFKSRSDQLERTSTMDVDMEPSGVSSMTTETLNSQMQEIYETINVLASGIQTLNDDTQRISSDSVRLQTSIETVTQECASLKLSIQEQSVFLNSSKQKQDIVRQEVASIKQKVDDTQYVSYDGTYTWNIKNVREKMNDAQSERQMSIYSPPFYSSPTGYKMCARLYLHGDGNARRTHMSLFFVLMRGLNDAGLEFPFNYKVTFCLYDQTPQQRHIIDSFRPDIKSNSFQRPRSEMNIASGIPKFCPLVMIQQEGNSYVRDDAMFIKVMVDFGEMPETLLPYAFSLNPGLPMHIQQTMIRQRSERQASREAQEPTKSPRTHYVTTDTEQTLLATMEVNTGDNDQDSNIATNIDRP